MYIVTVPAVAFIFHPSVSPKKAEEFCSIQGLSTGESDVKGFLLTHGHHDHIKYIDEWMAAYPDANVFFSSNDKDLLGNGFMNCSYMEGSETIYSFKFTNVAGMYGMNIIKEDGFEIKVFETPGHTMGSVCYLVSTGDEDMLSLIKDYLKKKYHKQGEAYLGLVHRLDRPVGGVMVFAKTSKAAARLSEQVRNKTFQKSYLVIVNGKMEQEAGTLEDYLIKNEKTNMSRVTQKDQKNAKLASLDYQVLKYDPELNLSVLKVNLHTGRHHQIRVQLSSRNHSIYGDQKYGGRGHGKQICLWAYQLTIEHPITHELMTFTQLPEMTGSWKILETINKSFFDES